MYYSMWVKLYFLPDCARIKTYFHGTQGGWIRISSPNEKAHSTISPFYHHSGVLSVGIQQNSTRVLLNIKSAALAI